MARKRERFSEISYSLGALSTLKKNTCNRHLLTFVSIPPRSQELISVVRAGKQRTELHGTAFRKGDAALTGTRHPGRSRHSRTRQQPGKRATVKVTRLRVLAAVPRLPVSARGAIRTQLYPDPIPDGCQEMRYCLKFHVAWATSYAGHKTKWHSPFAHLETRAPRIEEVRLWRGDTPGLSPGQWAWACGCDDAWARASRAGG